MISKYFLNYIKLKQINHGVDKSTVINYSQLPKNCYPLNYSIELFLDKYNLSYLCKTVIDIFVENDIDEIFLNYDNLTTQYEILKIEYSIFNKINDNWSKYNEIKYSISEDYIEAIKIKFSDKLQKVLIFV